MTGQCYENEKYLQNKVTSVLVKIKNQESNYF